MCVFFFRQRTAYELRISDWRSVVCSSDLAVPLAFAADAADAPGDAGSRAAAAFGVMFQQQGTSSNPCKAQPIARWCRDEVVGDNMRVYRPDDGSDRYLIALGDNGNAVLVGKTGAWSAVTPAGNPSAPYQILLEIGRALA